MFKAIVPLDDRDRRAGGWPQSPRALSPAIKRLIPDLRNIGIRVEIGEPDRRRSRIVTVRSMTDGTTSETTSASPATSADDLLPLAGNLSGNADDGRASADVFSSTEDTSAFSNVTGIQRADVADIADDSAEPRSQSS
ncbi:MAG: hypothetical protein GIW98_07110 [Candidatus Eremiobacteraeota bacterium]|nr:hypothetical protein [Candidatus Eremiobacteraeota bacterium]